MSGWNGNLSIAAAALALLAGCQQQSEAAPPLPEPVLSAAVVAQCRALINQAAKLGLIRARPSGARIDVEDATWAALPAKAKDRTLQAVACDVWQRAVPPQSGYVVAYGYRSGKRLQLFSAAGMDRE